jgi:hypothetical protein
MKTVKSGYPKKKNIRVDPDRPGYGSKHYPENDYFLLFNRNAENDLQQKEIIYRFTKLLNKKKLFFYNFFFFFFIDNYNV